MAENFVEKPQPSPNTGSENPSGIEKMIADLGMNPVLIQGYAMELIQKCKTARTQEEKKAAVGIYFLKINGFHL